MTPRPPASLRTLGTALLLVAGFLVVPHVASPASACANGHADVWLSGFDGVPQAPPFYMAKETQSLVNVTVEAMIHDCGSGTPAVFTWQTSNGLATAGSDYQQTSGTSENLNDNCGGDCPTGRDVPVTINNESLPPEPVAEHAWFTVDTPDGRILGPPTLPIFIVDDDGPSRAAFAPASTLQYRGQEYVTGPRIPVFRAGSDSSSMTINFSLAGSGPDPAEPADFSPASGQIMFPAGIRLAYIPLTVVNDNQVEDDETLTATLTGAGVEEPSTATYTIVDEDSDNQPPISRFHHPKDGWTYKRNDLKIREMHAFAKDPGAAELDEVHIALRQRKMNGSCRWWRGGGFTAGPCAMKDWHNMAFLQVWNASEDLYGYGLAKLMPSVGTTIKNYTAWTRSKDGAGNLETTFEAGRNLSTFEIKPP